MSKPSEAATQRAQEIVKAWVDRHARKVPNSGTYAELIDAFASELSAKDADIERLNKMRVPLRRLRPSKKQKIEDALKQSDLTAQLSGGRDDIEYGTYDSLPRGEHVARVRKG